MKKLLHQYCLIIKIGLISILLFTGNTFAQITWVGTTSTKIITSGEGGIVVTNDDQIAEKVRLYRNHGKPKPWITYNTHPGSNWRMSDITATIALSQMTRLDEIIKVREKVSNLYTKLIKEHLPKIKTILPQSRSSWYKYIVLLPKGLEREIVKNKMKERGIGLQGEVYGIPIHKQPIAKDFGLTGEFPHADEVCNRHICLPIYPGLSEEQIKRVIEELSAIIHAEMK